ncbi:MAG: mechanosensitive ion channel family protein [Eubacteriales bacterium]|nr:mechanosensitive ion channel family protein [Eubacteriales bacterium]
MKRKGYIVKFVIFAAIAAALYFTGGFTGSLGTKVDLSWANISRILLLLASAAAVEQLILFILDMLHPENHRARTVITLSANLVRYAAILVIIIGTMSLLMVDMPTILAGLGIIALIIGFGAESLITDVVTGFFILMDNQYNVGDIIEVAGFRGVVSEIGIRTTSLTDTGGNVKIINNSDMKNILNRSDNSSKAVTDFPVPYDTDLRALEKNIPAMLKKIYDENTAVFRSVPAYLGVQELADSAVVLRFVAEVGEADIYSGARLLNHDIFLAMKDLGIECPFTQVDVHNK